MSTGVSSLSTEKYGITTGVLPNGLTLVVIENHAVPLATIEICAKNGAFTEAPEFDGLSHLYEHMFFKANRALPSQERFLERTRELGMSWNGTTSEERVNYYFTLHNDDLTAGLQFMNDALRYPMFLHEELLREREVVAAEFDRAEASPFYQLHYAIGGEMWHKYFSRKNVLGDRQAVLTADEQKLRLIQSRYYIPNNSALIIAGDVKPADVLTRVSKIFGDWQMGPDPDKLFPIPEHPPLTGDRKLILKGPVDFVVTQREWHGPGMQTQINATYAADVFTFIVSQPDSAFQRNLVDTGHVDGVALGYQSQKHVGPIILSARTSIDRFAKAQQAIETELDQLDQPNYFTDEQIAFAKTQLEIVDIYGREQADGFAHTISYWWCSADLDYYQNYLDNLRQVTRADLDLFVQTYLKHQPSVTGILLSEENQRRLGGGQTAKESA